MTLARPSAVSHPVVACKTLLMAIYCAGTPAWVEVCDKVVGEDWRHEMGPQSLVYPLGNAIVPVAVLVIGCLVFWRLKLIKIPVVLGLLVAIVPCLSCWPHSGVTFLQAMAYLRPPMLKAVGPLRPISLPLHS